MHLIEAVIPLLIGQAVQIYFHVVDRRKQEQQIALMRYSISLHKAHNLIKDPIEG